jgi:hypothetical protein
MPKNASSPKVQLWIAASAAALSLAVMPSARAQDVPAHNPPGLIIVRGTVVSVGASKLTIRSASGVVTVNVVRPFHLYQRAAGSMSGVTGASYVGVTSVKQPDGSQRATEIHIFPQALRGLGEGSYMMPSKPGAAAGRMTNGKVTASRMTNGRASRMSNGTVRHVDGSSLIVQYAGGAQTITIPPDTPVTQLQLTAAKLTPGEQVFAVARKSAGGGLTSNEAIAVPR